MIWANSVLPTFMGPLGLYKPKSIAKERNEFQIVDTPKTARHPVVIGFFAIDHQLNRTLLDEINGLMTRRVGCRALSPRYSIPAAVADPNSVSDMIGVAMHE